MDIAGAVLRKFRLTPRYKPARPSLRTMNAIARYIEKSTTRWDPPFRAARRNMRSGLVIFDGD
jgi:hypothetical protein